MAAEEKGKAIDAAGLGLILAKCPTCGAILTIKGRGEVRCDYCGNIFILRESYKGKSREIQNYYDLAYAAQEIGDAAKAYEYFTKILELDSREALAWYGKGAAALNCTEPRKLDVTEVVSLFKRALPNVEGEEQDQLRETIQKRCFGFADSAFDYLRNRSLLNGVNFRGILALFGCADEVLPLDNERLKRIITILFSNTSTSLPYTYTLSFLSSPEAEKTLDYYSDRIRATEPGYLNPREEGEARERRERGRFKVSWGPVLIVLICVVSCILCILFTKFYPG